MRRLKPPGPSGERADQLSERLRGQCLGKGGREHAATRYECTLKYIHAHVSLATFEKGDQAVNAGGSTPGWAFKALAACVPSS